MRVLYFGTYERDYPRNAQVVSCLRRAGVEVVERHVSVWDDERHKLSLGVGGLARIVAAEVRLVFSSARDADLVIVGYPGHLDMLAAKRVAWGRPIVCNPLVSLEDTMVGDRGLLSPSSSGARAMRLVDRISFRLADLVVADTAAHASYFVQQYALREDRVAVCFASTEDRLFRPRWRPQDDFYCLFFGKMIPLHGLDTILDAARLVPDIRFKIAGTGQLDGLLRDELPPNVDWVRWVAHERIPDELSGAGCALGIFGTTDKAQRVIPNKAFEAIACGTPLITGNTPAARELFTHEIDSLLVAPGQPASLAEAIRRLASDSALRRRIAAAGRATYERHASEEVLGQRWRALLERVSRASAAS